MSNLFRQLDTHGFIVRHEFCGHRATVWLAMNDPNRAVIFECATCNEREGNRTWVGVSVHAWQHQEERVVEPAR